MDPVTQLDYFGKEHLDILRFLDKWEDAVRLITSKDHEQRTKALSKLRDMESELQRLSEITASRKSGISSRLIARRSRKSSSIL